MNKFGIMITFLGLFGFWHFLSDVTGIPNLNTITKDQITVVFGILMVLIKEK